MKDFSAKLLKLLKLQKTLSGTLLITVFLTTAPLPTHAQDLTPLKPGQTVVPLPPASIPPVPETPPPAEAPVLPPKPVFVPPDLVPVVEKLDIFFNTLAKEGSAAAYTALLEGSGLLTQTAIVTDVVTNTDAAFKAFGNISGFERIQLRRTGERLVSITYIGYCPRWPIRWNFVCYLGGSRWQILDIDISNDLDLMIDRGRKRLKDVPPE